MASSLCIHVLSPEKESGQEIRFFDSDSWDADSERQIMARIQDILMLARTSGVAVHFSIRIESQDPAQLAFILKKKAVLKESFHHSINLQKLSIREMEVLGLIMQGLTNQEIADRLFISFETVRSHRKNILEKTGAKNSIALMNYYHQTFFEK